MAEKGRNRQKSGQSGSASRLNPNTGSVWQLPSHAALQSGDAEGRLQPQASGMINVQNPKITAEVEDVLYHLGLSTTMDLKAMFGDVKFVLMGGSAQRAEKLAHTLIKRLGMPVPVGLGITPVGKTERYSLFKVGPCISVNHGMGMPSMSILLHEITKLLFHAEAIDVTYVRIGTSGGLGLEGGTVVVARNAVDSGSFKPEYKHRIMGKEHTYPSSLDQQLAEVAFDCAKGDGTDKLPVIPCVLGNTMGTDDFYEGQGRVDGCLCDYEESDRDAWLQKAYEAGVRNIEMESTMFACFCLRAKIPAVLINTVLLNRLNGDQVTSTPEQLASFSSNSQEVAIRLVIRKLRNIYEKEE